VQHPAVRLATIVYVFYAIGPLTFGISAILGLVVAMQLYGVPQEGNPPWIASHYRFLTRTFWIALAAVVVGSLLTGVLIGYLVLPAALGWYWVRCAKGYGWLREGNPPPDPDTLWI